MAVCFKDLPEDQVGPKVPLRICSTYRSISVRRTDGVEAYELDHVVLLRLTVSTQRRV